MTLEDALAYARQHHPQLLSALQRIDAQRAQSAVVRSHWLPSFGVTGQLFGATANNTTASYLSTGVVDLPRIGGTRVLSAGSLRPYASTLVAVGGNQELFDFGRIAAQAAVEDAQLEGERTAAQAVLLDVSFAVEESYFGVLAAHAIVNVAASAYTRAAAYRDLAKAGVDAGLRSPIELTRAQAELARSELAQARASGGLALAQAVFAAATGVEDAALDAAGQPKTAADLPVLADAMRQASERDPHLLALLSELRAQELHARAVSAELRPDLSLTAAVSSRAGGGKPSGNGQPAGADGWLPEVVNWDVGVVFTWPLFDATVNARSDAAKARGEVARSELTLARHEQVAAIRLAYLQVQTARAALPLLQGGVEAAHANHAQADARFRAGLGTSVELADAEALRQQAEVQLAMGQFELARTRAVFGRAIAEGL